MTQAQLMAAVKALGLNLKYISDVGEWRLNIAGGTEATAYYSSDPQDVLDTAHAMVRHSAGMNEESLEWLTPISESTSPDAHILALEGYDYFAEVSGSSTDKLIDWLEENQVEFLTNGSGHFHIKCGTRESAYKVSRAISGFGNKAVVRDSVHQEESIMSEKNKGGPIEIASADLKAVRDPVLRAMHQRGGGGAHKIDPRKADPHSRHAKHKKAVDLDEGSEYLPGQRVLVNEIECVIKIPRGPNGTVGVMMNDQLSMVSADSIRRIDESVLGMTPLSPLFRLRELAGLPPGPLDEPEGHYARLAFGSNPAEDLKINPDLDPSMPGLDDGGSDLGLPSEPVPSMDPMAAGVPGDLPPMPVEAPMMAPSQSEAMSHIEDCLNDVQSKLAEIRLAEYKTLIQKLQDLTTQVQMMGRDYLGERRKK